MNGLGLSRRQLCREVPAGLAVCRAPFYEQVVHALIGRMHLCKGLAESQLLALPCTTLASPMSRYFSLATAQDQASSFTADNMADNCGPAALVRLTSGSS